MNSQQRKLFIDTNAQYIKDLGHSGKMIRYLSENGITITPKDLFGELFPSRVKTCDKAKFVAISVGYRTCAKGCPCYTESLSKKMRDWKKSYTPEKNAQILAKRTSTNLDKYGVECVFELEQVKDQSTQTKLDTYGDANYNNRDKCKATCLELYGHDNVAKTDSVQAAMTRTCVERYGVDYAINSPVVQAKIKSTLYENYGVTVATKSPVIVDRIKATNMTRYGVDNVRKNAAIKQKIREKGATTIYNRYLTGIAAGRPLFTEQEFLNGARGPWQCSVCSSVIDGSISNGILPRCTACMPYSISVFECEIRDYINSVYTGPVVYNNRKLIWPKEIDIYLPQFKLGIECNGVYRHTELTGSKTQDYHSDKTTRTIKAGIRLLHVDSVQWRNRGHVVKSMISHRLGLSSRIHARRTWVVQLTNHMMVNDFLQDHHLNGAKCYDVAYGLVSDQDVVAVMTFRYEDQWIMQQFCTQVNTTVVGGGSKLMRAFIRHHSPQHMVSHSDRMLGNGAFHTLLGMTHTGDTPPDYTYYVKGQLYARPDVPHQLITEWDTDLSEWDNMVANGHDRMWDAGKSTWVWTPFPHVAVDYSML